MVELALEMLRAETRPDRRLRIADIGTGSGAILLALLSELPDGYGVGTDISQAALRPRADQRRRSGARRRAPASSPVDYAAALSGGFDLIVSNPPYIRSAEIAELATEVRDHDPLHALDGGADGLDAYRAIIPQAAGLLAPRRRTRHGGRAHPERGRWANNERGRVNDRGAAENRSGGYRAGGRGPKIAPIKPDWKAKNHLEYSPGATTFRLQHRSRVAGPVDAAGEGQGSQSESPPRVKGSKTQVQFERDGFRELRCF